LYYNMGKRTWDETYWMGTKLLKCPLDLWIYQELLYELRPDVIVETGTRYGGSASYIASLCDLLGHGRVITIDVEDQEGRPQHPRIQYLLGSSVAPETLQAVREQIGNGNRVLVVLDSDHSRDHVLAELRGYADLVSPGSYVVVEDTNVNGHPVSPFFGPGPWEAVRDFLAEDERFEIDRRREKFYMTFNPSGHLRRIK
jgi:cephalosporin hydroxylase